jgi:hypothetical protein
MIMHSEPLHEAWLNLRIYLRILPLIPYGRYGILEFREGVVGSRWAPRSSKPVAGCTAGRGGFDSHPLPPSYS